MSASAGGASATVYNPAGLIRKGAGGTEIQFTHREWVQDVRMEFLGAAVAFDEANALGISLQTATIAGIDIRTRPGPPEGSFTARTFALGISYARAFDATLRVGATAKLLYQKILVDDATGFAVDLGIQFDPGPKGLSLGAAVSNLGTGGTLRTETTTLPAFARAGAAYRFSPAEEIEGAVMGDLFSVLPDNQSFFNLGGEVRLQHMVAVRGGYQFGSEGRGFMGGIGVAYGIVKLDYAYAPLSQDLGNTHTVSIAVGF
jgi:hypothetical protein